MTNPVADLTAAEKAAVQVLMRQTVQRTKSYASSTNASDAFWEWTKHIKTRDEAKAQVLPFPRYQFLIDAERQQETHNMNVWLKPRQMFISNLNCAKRLFRASRAQESSGQAYCGLLVSIGEREAMELMNRIWFMYNSLPDHMREPVAKKTETELKFVGGGRLVCLPASAKIGHSYTATDIFLDEWARLPFAHEMHAGLLPTVGPTGRVDGVSTPNGPFGVFADIWHQEDSLWNKIELAWEDHPLRDDEWAEAEKRKVCPDYPHDLSIWLQQYEKQFNVFTDKAVYPGFTAAHVVNDLKYDPAETLYRGWDFGGHVAAVVFFQVVGRQVRVLREVIVMDFSTPSKAKSIIVDPDNNVDDLARRVIDMTRGWYGPDVRVRDFCDPQGAHVSDMSRKSERSRIAVLNQYGIYPEYRFSNISEGIEIIRMHLRKGMDQEFGLVINGLDAPVLTDGLRGGISRRPPPTNQPFASDESIRKDGFYEHPHDAFRYGMVGVLRTTERPRQARVNMHPVRRDPMTGVPI